MRTQKNLDLVDAVVTSLTKANLTNASDKVFVASEDSSALAALQNLIPAVKTVYAIPYQEGGNAVSVTTPVLQVCLFQVTLGVLTYTFFGVHWLQMH